LMCLVECSRHGTAATDVKHEIKIWRSGVVARFWKCPTKIPGVLGKRAGAREEEGGGLFHLL
jgi:hypothetical protein